MRSPVPPPKNPAPHSETPTPPSAFAGGEFADEMRRMIAGLDEVANDGNALATEVTLPLSRGIEAFAHGAYDDAADHLDGLVDHLPRLGGSHAQREVFEDTILESYIRAGRFDKAQDLLHTRLKRRTTVRDELWLQRTEGE